MRAAYASAHYHAAWPQRLWSYDLMALYKYIYYDYDYDYTQKEKERYHQHHRSMGDSSWSYKAKYICRLCTDRYHAHNAIVTIDEYDQVDSMSDTKIDTNIKGKGNE